MNHSFACAKDAQKETPCSQWCGNKHTCLSTLTYASPALQEAYEKGHFDAKWAMENELARMARDTSPHRRVAAEDLYRALCKIRPVAFDIMPTAEAPAAGVGADAAMPHIVSARPLPDTRLVQGRRSLHEPDRWERLYEVTTSDGMTGELWLRTDGVPVASKTTDGGM